MEIDVIQRDVQRCGAGIRRLLGTKNGDEGGLGIGTRLRQRELAGVRIALLVGLQEKIAEQRVAMGVAVEAANQEAASGLAVEPRAQAKFVALSIQQLEPAQGRLQR